MKKLPASARRCLSIPALAAALAFGGAAEAASISFDFENTGYLADLGACGPTCVTLAALAGNATSTSLNASWAYFASADVNKGDTSVTGNWALRDLNGANDLAGTFVATLTGYANKIATGSIAYTIKDTVDDVNAGIFAGATGSGKTSFSVFPDFSYYESGSFTAVTAPVPEPGTWVMMGAGLLGLGAIARRRAQAPQT